MFVVEQLQWNFKYSVPILIQPPPYRDSESYPDSLEYQLLVSIMTMMNKATIVLCTGNGILLYPCHVSHRKTEMMLENHQNIIDFSWKHRIIGQFYGIVLDHGGMLQLYRSVNLIILESPNK
jgi:hypothetical protein